MAEFKESQEGKHIMQYCQEEITHVVKIVRNG